MKTLHLLLCVAVAGVFFACDRNTTYVEEIAGPAGCADCHEDGNLITGKQTQWAESRHGTNESYLRGTSASCAGCHSGTGFTRMVEAGVQPNGLTEGDTDPTRQDCRACHQIHETYTKRDFALRTTSAVPLYAITGATYDGGSGNLCANCHQPRRDGPVAVGGVVTGISEHWGLHHGPQTAMLLGLAGAGAVVGSAHQHYGVQNTCVNCHMGDGDNHTFEAQIASCRVQACHPGAANFDINGRQTEIEALADQLGAELVALGLINESTADGHPIVTSAPENQAYALWNWLYVHHEDKSMGAHNYPYAKALLEESLALLNPSSAQGRKAPGAGGSK